MLLIVVCLLWQPIGGAVYDDAPACGDMAHALVQLLGFWLMRAPSRGSIRSSSPASARRPSHRALQVDGPYRLVRHPLYLGWLLVVFGAAHMTGDRLLFAMVTTLYLVIAIPWEERSLLRSFGGEYARYMRDVRWRMIPFIY